MKIAGLTAYNARLALKNIAKTPVLSGLMVAAIAIGIGTSMSMITINYMMSQNPIPHKSDRLFVPQLDTWSPEEEFFSAGGVPNQLTYIDAMALQEAARAFRQTANARTGLAVELPDGETPFFVNIRTNHTDFFPMFDVPFAAGGPWPAAADEAGDAVVVLSAELNERVFGGEDSVGRTLRLSGRDYRIVGVLDEWQPIPKYYDVTSNAFSTPEEAYIPFRHMINEQLPRRGNTNCWKSPDGAGYEAFLNSECIWTQFWVELRNDAERADYLTFLNAYTEEQKALGRMPRPMNNRLHDVMEWLELTEVVIDDARVLLGLSLIFLVVCLLNTVGLLLAKFFAKAPEIGVRRALGASRGVLFQQYLIESALIGATGGALGLGFAWIGLQVMERLFDAADTQLMNIDWTMANTSVVLAVGVTLLTAIVPTWRACNIQPAAYLKAQ
jgi:putative ABC transport system permease protein